MGWPRGARTQLAQSFGLALAMLAGTVFTLGAVEIVLIMADTSATAPPRWIVVGFTLVGGVYLAAGLAAWWRRPSSRVGPLVVIGALTWIGSNLTNTLEPALIAFGTVVATTPIALVVHLLHAYPSGRLADRASRWIVGAGWLVVVLLQAPLYLFTAAPPPHDVLLLADRPDLATLGNAVQRVAGSAVVVATATVLIRRLRRAAPGQRRVLAPLYSYGVVAVLFIPLSGAVLRPLLGMSPETLVALQLVVLAGVPVAFVLGMLRGGFARTGEVEELAAWLGSSAPARPGLTRALARALGDDTLELVFWVPEQNGYVDAGGRAVTLPAAGSGRAAVEVELADRRVGAIIYDATLIADAEIVRAAGRVTGLAVDRERLTAELRASEDALRRSRVRIVEAADRERRRIARNLHDGLQVRLVVLALQAQQVAGRGEGPVRDAAVALRAGVDEAAADLRRLVHAVMPAALVERGLAAATEDLVDRMPLPTRLDMSIADGALPAAVESTAYFVVAEGLANALKHAQAGRLEVRLARGNGHLCVEVSDDGRGGAAPRPGSGLRGLADRVDTLGGRLRVDHVDGGGTRLVAELPCGS